MGQGAYAFFSWSKGIWLVATTVFLAERVRRGSPCS